MRKFSCHFYGRYLGAIGIGSWFSNVIIEHENDNREEIRLKIYDKYDHIMFLTITELKEEEKTLE